jgi:branched-chain amino acid transport system substrate-binding protein
MSVTHVRRWLVRGAGLLMLLAGAAACGNGRSPAEERARQARRGTGEVVVAVAWPWKRHADMHYGEGLDLAVEEINGSGGIGQRPLRLQRHDDRGELDEGMLVAQRIAADAKVVGVIGHLQSFITTPAAALYEMAGLVTIVPMATDPELTAQGHRRVFRATFTDRDSGRKLAEFAASRFQRVAICYIGNTYGRGLANAFEERARELGLMIPARQSYDPGEQVSARTFLPLVEEWKLLEVDAVFLAGEVPSAGLFVVQARAAGLTVPIFAGDAVAAPTLMATAGKAAEGMIVASFFHSDEPRPEVERFKQRFHKRFGRPPDPAAAIGYDVAHLMARAMRKAGSVVPEDVARAMREGPPYQGATGSFQFDAQGAAVGKQPVLMTVSGGKFVYSAATALIANKPER